MKTAALLVLLLATCEVSAQVRLPKLFSDNMVLQRDVSVPVWGWAGPNAKVTVQFKNQTKTARADKLGKWIVKLESEPAGGPYQLIVKSTNTIVLNNIVMGDVWVCSGQSNMEWPVQSSNNAAQEIQQANYPNIRHFKVPNTVASEPKDDVTGGEWKICNPENAGNFTAVGYFFAREIFRKTNVPIGLLNTSWGGTHVETWTSRKAFEDSEEFREMISGMRKLNLDSLAKQRTAASKARIEKLTGSLPASAQEVKTWKDDNVNDSNWRMMQVPGLWEQQELGDFDGVVWLRTKFNLNQSDIADAELSLAMIDDSDVTYVNGIKVGSMDKYNEKRLYKIPAGILKPGVNTIAVRVDDTGGGGGIYGNAADVKITTANTTRSLAGNWSYRVESAHGSSGGIGPNSYPTLLFNAMIHPLLNYKIKGVLWYQGEANAGRAYQYRKAFPLMISDWRAQWGEGAFPFYFVQLASFNAGNGDSNKGSSWAELREAQAATLSLPNTGMAVTTDIGDPNDIHPRNKQDVGKRLAAIALHNTYGKDVVAGGPSYQSMKVDGDSITILFNNTGSGLTTTDKYGYVKGFEIAGADRTFHYAQAILKNDRIVVFQRGVTNPSAVRYGWADDASESNLYNREGFPAVPFRTDNWTGLTEKGKFVIGE